MKLINNPSNGVIFLTYKECINTEGTTQKDTVSAMESNSIPNFDSMPRILAILPSKTSKTPAKSIRTPAFKGSSFMIKPIDIKNQKHIYKSKYVWYKFF